MRRPYVFLYRDERDPCERVLINLATAKTEFSSHHAAATVNNAFRYSSLIIKTVPAFLFKFQGLTRNRNVGFLHRRLFVMFINK